jgi:hypothetical protein
MRSGFCHIFLPVSISLARVSASWLVAQSCASILDLIPGKGKGESSPERGRSCVPFDFAQGRRPHESDRRAGTLVLPTVQPNPWRGFFSFWPVFSLTSEHVSFYTYIIYGYN